jgi:hypothetical protein
MATLIIRNVPPEVDAMLKDEARKQRRSGEKQALYLIERGLARRVVHDPKALARIQATQTRRITTAEILAATEEAH